MYYKIDLVNTAETHIIYNESGVTVETLNAGNPTVYFSVDQMATVMHASLRDLVYYGKVTMTEVKQIGIVKDYNQITEDIKASIVGQKAIFTHLPATADTISLVLTDQSPIELNDYTIDLNDGLTGSITFNGDVDLTGLDQLIVSYEYEGEVE